jgi:hypothetical protein
MRPLALGKEGINLMHTQKLTSFLLDLPIMSLLVCQVSMLLLVLTRKQSWSEVNTWGKNSEAKVCTFSWAQVNLQIPLPLNFRKAYFFFSLSLPSYELYAQP